MSQYKSFDALFSSILTAYQNAGLATSITVGDELYVRAAGLASLVWGTYRECDWVANQIWPDTASDENLLHWGAIYGLTKNEGETYASYLARLLQRLRNPTGGGNKTDYEGWAMEVSYGSEVPSQVTCYGGADAYGAGTVVLVVSKADGTLASTELLAAIRTHVLEKGPVVPAEVYVLAPEPTSITVSLTMTGGDTALALQLIQSFLASLATGQTVYPEVFAAFCWQAGATSVVQASPLAVVAPGKFGRVEASSVTVASA